MKLDIFFLFPKLDLCTSTLGPLYTAHMKRTDPRRLWRRELERQIALFANCHLSIRDLKRRAAVSDAELEKMMYAALAGAERGWEKRYAPSKVPGSQR